MDIYVENRPLGLQKNCSNCTIWDHDKNNVLAGYCSFGGEKTLTKWSHSCDNWVNYLQKAQIDNILSNSATK